MKKYWKDGAAVFTLILLTVLVFWWVPHVYFQQDEWFSIGQSLLAKTDPSTMFRVTNSIHFSPVAQLWFAFQYALFGMHAAGYGMVSVLSHCTVIVLAYVLLRMLSISSIPSFFGMAFFALNPVSSQVVSWISASQFAGPSLILFLSGCILWIWNLKKKIFLVSVGVAILLWGAMFAKEDVISGYVCIFTVWLLFLRKKHLSFRPIIISFAGWLILYMYIWVFRAKENGAQHYRSMVDSVSYLVAIPRWMANIIITHNTLRSVLQRFFGRYTFYLPFIDNDPLLKLFSAIISAVWFFWYLATAWITKLPFKKVLVFPILIAVSTLPYFLSFSTELESRHYYIPVLLTGIGIAWFLDWVMKMNYRGIYKITLIVLVLFISAFACANQPQNDYLSFQNKRETIVSGMQTITTPSNTSVVYFIENGDRLPFQSGVGQMLLVLQARGDRSFDPYIRMNFLWMMFGQGYKSAEEKGFGYYFEFDKLTADYQKGLFDISAIRAYAYDTNTLVFHDITKQVVGQIQTGYMLQ